MTVTATRPRPPLIGRLLLRLRRLGDRHDEVEADLLELFALRATERGRRYAGWRYRMDALSLWRCRRSGVVGTPRRHREWGHEMRRDIIFAARLFRRQPGLFGVTIAGLALAIGISTTVFSIVNAAAFRGSGISEPESVFRLALANGMFTQLTGNSPMQGDWQYSDYRGLQRSPGRSWTS